MKGGEKAVVNQVNIGTVLKADRGTSERWDGELCGILRVHRYHLGLNWDGVSRFGLAVAVRH